jgi:DNA-binding response OmpR family regulator
MIMTADVRALVVTTDQRLSAVFSDISRELGINVHVAATETDVPGELHRKKYEALLIDFDRITDAVPIITCFRQSPWNKQAVVLAIATGLNLKQYAISQGANFVFERPFAPGDLRRALQASYEVMIQERRRYFRYSVELPVEVLRQDGTLRSATTMNVSSAGMAFLSKNVFQSGEHVKVVFRLEEVETSISTHAVVIWDDKHGKTGVNFRQTDPTLQKAFDAWLDRKFMGVRDN